MYLVNGNNTHLRFRQTASYSHDRRREDALCEDWSDELLHVVRVPERYDIPWSHDGLGLSLR